MASSKEKQAQASHHYFWLDSKLVKKVKKVCFLKQSQNIQEAKQQSQGGHWEDPGAQFC